MFDESFNQSWELRFGTEAPQIGIHESSLDRFLAHRSIRSYSDQPIGAELLASLIGVAQGAATSSNLQLWSVISIQDAGRRETLAMLCGDQQHIREAPVFLVFCVDLYRLNKAAEEVGEKAVALNTTEFYTMGVVDAALAGERLVCAAEHIGVGGCYIGAIRNNAFAVRDLLQLPSQCFGVFGLCLGYPAETVIAEVKPRLPQNVVWHRETYNTEAGIGNYNERMVEFYQSQGMNPAVNWSMRSGRRVNGTQMTGREVLKEFLTSQNLDVI